LPYSGIDEILVSHFMQTEKCQEVTLIRKAIPSIFKPLKMVFRSSCDSIPLKLKKKNRLASSLLAWMESAGSVRYQRAKYEVLLLLVKNPVLVTLETAYGTSLS
jgi:hypothetical protein